MRYDDMQRAKAAHPDCRMVCGWLRHDRFAPDPLSDEIAMARQDGTIAAVINSTGLHSAEQIVAEDVRTGDAPYTIRLAPAVCCPECGHGLDDAAILSAAGRINAARRKTRGHATPEQLREAGRKGGRAKGARRASS
ncbi:MAG: hypothetical protein GX595_14295 [Lentisphaerae bacterium]|nr:hypothetical protein [Lentisphaerota bacterium]